MAKRLPFLAIYSYYVVVLRGTPGGYNCVVFRRGQRVQQRIEGYLLFHFFVFPSK